jgi:hypothetical protein
VIFRRRESLHQRLAREGGLDSRVPPPSDPRPPFETGIHGVARAREWDAVVIAETASIAGDEARFVGLSDGTLLVEEGPEEDLSPLAEAVEQRLEAPYRAEAVRREDRLWSVAARRIAVVELPEDVDGEQVLLSVHGDERELSVDGERRFGSVPALERVADGRSGAYVVHAERLDGNLWEVRLSAL